MRRIGMRRSVPVVMAAFTLALSGAAGASVLGSHPSSTPVPHVRHGRTGAAGETAAGTHGGPIERYWKAGACDLVDASALPGRFNHGRYVSAVARAGETSLVPTAARSDCGKPMVAVGSGGPPAPVPAAGGWRSRPPRQGPRPHVCEPVRPRPPLPSSSRSSPSP